MQIEQMISEMSVEEKVALVSGTNFMYINAIPNFHIPSLYMADGPHGLRKQTGEQDNGVSQSEPATAFPTAVTTASSWNPNNTRKMGEAIGQECRYYHVHVLLGPGANIKRNPTCGRNFEYFSEDPFLASEMAIGEVNGVQSQGVGVSVKHFAMNNSENYRFMGNSIADERAIREIYLKVFERIVKEAHPATMMCAYNQINGDICSENTWLLNEMLRKEWGFHGAVMTDWGAIRDRVKGIQAGLDLEMPGDTAICRRQLLDALENQTLSMEDMDTAVRNILTLIDTYCKNEDSNKVDWQAHHQLAGEIAADSAVLMKNNGVLPLKGNEDLLVVGDMFEKMRYQGSGSSMIHPTMLTTSCEAFEAKKIKYTYTKGYTENKVEVQKELIDEAIDKAKNADTILIFAGQTDTIESEGADRTDLKLPANQLALIQAMIEIEKPVVVVLFGGSVVELPFADKAAAILHMFLPGQDGGNAVVNLLTGVTNPSGKLAETWPYQYEDVPFGNTFGTTVQEVYKESIYVGYRYYDTASIPVRYPFGYGLSYTTFAYDNLQVDASEKEMNVTFTIQNTGNCYGGEIAQVYIKAPDTKVYKPNKELRAFQKVYLQPGEIQTITLTITYEQLRYFNTKEKKWVLETGKYQVMVGKDCADILLQQACEIKGESIDSPYNKQTQDTYGKVDIHAMTTEAFQQMSGIVVPELPAKYPLNMESRFTDLKQTFMGRILFSAVLSVANKQKKQAEKLPEGSERDNKLKGALFLKRILESNSIRSMSMSAGKSMPYQVAQGFVLLANGHFIKGIKSCLSKIEVPALPSAQKG